MLNPSEHELLSIALSRRGPEWEDIITTLSGKTIQKIPPGVCTLYNEHFTQEFYTGKTTLQTEIKSRTRKKDPRIIQLIAKANPKPVNTPAHLRFEIYRSGMSVDEYVALGGNRSDIRWDIEHGFIVVDLSSSKRFT